MDYTKQLIKKYRKENRRAFWKPVYSGIGVVVGGIVAFVALYVIMVLISCL